MYTVYCGRVCCNFSKLSDADYFARKNGTEGLNRARTKNENGVKKENVGKYTCDLRI